jgi:membrane fusion protein (multidrug efflux system)
MNRGRISQVVGMAVVAAVVGGCGKQGGGRAEMAVPVVATEAVERSVAETIALVGNMEANEVVEVKTEVDGTIEAITFEEGQPVEASTPLIQIDATRLKAALAQAEANLTLAEATRRRYEGLVEAGAVARQELDQALATFEANQAAAEAAREQLEDATVVAPFQGMVSARRVSLGQYVAVGETITWLIDGDPMKVEFRVPERYLGRVAVDQEVQLRVDAYPDEQFGGRVYFIDPQIDEATRTALIKAMVPNDDGRLRRGMFTEVTLTIGTRPNAVVIPETAVIHDADRTIVFVIEQEQAQPRPVRLGQRLPGEVEVVEGVAAGEVVVTEGTQKLRPGAKVVARRPGSDITSAEVPPGDRTSAE